MKFRTKIFLCLILVLSLFMGISGALIIKGSFQDALDAEWYNAALSYQMTASMLELTGRVDMEALGQIQDMADWNCAQLCRDGEVIYQLGKNYTELLPPASTAECASRLFGESYIQFTGLVDVGGQKLELTLVQDVSTAYANRDRQLTVYHTVFLAAVTAGGLLCWVLAYLLTRPLGRMSRAVRRIAAGSLSVRLECKDKGEMGQLSADFNHMAEQLQENIHAIEGTMAAQERFMGSFAHELKTPMTSIIGYADLLRTQSITGMEAQEAANYIFSEAKRLESLGLKLLELLVAKNEMPHMEDLSIRDMIYSQIERLKPIYQAEGIHLTCYCQKGSCRGEEELLRSVMINLLDNARKAMTAGGKIHVVSKFEENTCRICVIDNGSGIPPEALEHLTEAFYRIDKSRSRAQGGAGLGLALCQQIIARHGGHMEFYSKLGVGTCVVVFLPRGKEQEK